MPDESPDFQDHFSGHADLYRAARPQYTDELFAWLASVAPGHELAWDAGCGNGQATRALAPHFARVIGTDPSSEQVARALAVDNVEYRVEPAERSSLDDASADIATVSQALHWFDLDAYYAEVRRVLRPGGVLAAVVYTHFASTPAIDVVRDRLYTDILGPYWPGERRHVESGYRTLPFPFDELEVPHFQLTVEWTLAQLLDYLRSWSSSQRYVDANGSDPVALVVDEFGAAWTGAPTEPLTFTFDLHIRAGRV